MPMNLNATIQACFVNEMEPFKTYRDTPTSSSKKGKQSTSESEHLVLDVMEQIAPILIKNDNCSHDRCNEIHREVGRKEDRQT